MADDRLHVDPVALQASRAGFEAAAENLQAAANALSARLSALHFVGNGSADETTKKFVAEYEPSREQTLDGTDTISHFLTSVRDNIQQISARFAALEQSTTDQLKKS